MSLRNIGSGIGVCQGWGVRAGLPDRSRALSRGRVSDPDARPVHPGRRRRPMAGGDPRPRAIPYYREIADAISQREPDHGRAPLLRPDRRSAHDHPLHAGAARPRRRRRGDSVHQRRSELVPGSRRAALTRSRTAAASAAIWRTISPAGRACTSSWACPAHRLNASASPCAARGGAQRARDVVDLRVGDRRDARCSAMNRLTIPRAGRPVNARVTRVGRRSASTARCASAVPASGASISAVPTWAALAPAHSTAASAAPSAIPPVATSGSGVARATTRSSASSPIPPSSEPSSTNPPR